MAAMSEAKPFVIGMKLEQTEERPFKIFRNRKTALIISGIGKSNAAMAAFYTIRKFNSPDMINIGSAGANDAFHPLGNIYQADRIYESDSFDTRTRKPFFYLPETFHGIQSASLSTIVNGHTGDSF